MWYRTLLTAKSAKLAKCVILLFAFSVNYKSINKLFEHDY